MTSTPNLPLALRNDNDECYRGTYGQNGLWLTQKMYPDSCAYNILRVFLLKGDIVPSHIKNAFIRLLNRHSSLRAVFSALDNKLLQSTIKSQDFFQEINATTWTEEEIEKFYKTKALIPFNLEQDPLFKVFLLVQQTGAVLVLVIHHIVIDLWSEIILSQEFIEAYRCESNHTEPTFSTLKASYQIFAREEKEKLSGPKLEELSQFWKRSFTREIQPLNLPFAKPRPPIQTFNGGECRYSLSGDKVNTVKACASQNGTTVYTFLLSVFHALIRRYTGQSELIVGTATAGRSHARYKNVVGYFVNPVAIKLSADGANCFSDLLLCNQKSVEESLKHKDMPFSLVLEQLSIKRDSSYAPLFQVMFNYMGKLPFWTSKQEIEIGSGQKVIMEPVRIESCVAQFELVVNVSVNENQLDFVWEYNTDIFAKEDIENLVRGYQLVLKQALTYSGFSLSETCLMEEEQEIQILTQSSGRLTERSSHSTLFSWFESQVLKTPESIAIVVQNQKISYSQLLDKVEQMSSILKAKGIKPGQVVALILPVSAEVIVAILSILKIGAAFLPIDAQYPAERIQFMLKDSQACAVTVREYALLLGQYPSVIFFDEMVKEPQSCLEKGEPNAATGFFSHALAYIIYTSGSTGTPKGVMISHRSIMNYIDWAIRTYMDEMPKGVPLFSSLAFDLTLTSIFVPLLSGKTLYTYAHPNVDANLREILDEKQVEFCKLTPSHLVAMRELLQEKESLPSISAFVVGGEDFNTFLARAVGRHLHEEALLYNEYGPTEASVGCMIHVYDRIQDQRTSVPIGYPIDNMDVYILNDDLQLQPSQVPGELYISGEGLAWGYLNRPDITAEKFLPHPFKSGKRMYKTGDLAQRLKSGVIEYLGRIDHQVKIRGFRIEFGEIEHYLRLQGDIKEALVIEYNSKLVAYVVAEGNSTCIDLEGIQFSLSNQLPSYMVPDFIIPLDAFPLTSNGKVDKTRLPIPQINSLISRDYCPPVGKIEHLLTEIWADILTVDLEKIGVTESFFELGGDSIKAIQITSRVRRAGFKCEIQDLFLFSTVRQLGKHLQLHSISSIENAINYSFTPSKLLVNQDKDSHDLYQKYGETIEGVYPLTSIQEGILFHSSLDSSSDVYFEQMSCTLETVIDEGRFRETIEFLKSRHELLRSTFHTNKNGETKCIVLKERELEVFYQDLSFLDLPAQQAFLRQFAEEDRREHFDLFNSPLMRVALFKLSESNSSMLWSAHHILLDGWCLGVISRDFSNYYRFLVFSDQEMAFPTVGYYRDYMEWYLVQDRVTSIEYWKNYLQNYEGPSSVLGLSISNLEYERQEYRFCIPLYLIQSIKTIAAKHGVTLNAVFQAVWSMLLYKWNSKKDIVFGTVMAIRPPEVKNIENMVGLFINTVPVRVRLGEKATWQDIAGQIQGSQLRSQHYAFTSLGDIQKQVYNGHQLIDHLFVFGNYPFEKDRKGTTHMMMKDFSVFEQTNYNFNIYVNPGDAFEICFIYNAKIFVEKAVREIGASFLKVLEQIVEHPQRCLQDIEYVTDDTKASIFFDSHGAFLPSHQKSLSEYFEEKAQAIPSHPALVFGPQIYTYGEIDCITNQFAHFLRKKGVGPNSIVAVYAERSCEMIIALLAILKAGGAYMPLDIQAPKERLQTILEESKCELLISRGSFDILVDIEMIPLVCSIWETEPMTSLPPTAGAHDLAYVLYTSGSTGVPKGVMIEQQSIINLLKSLQSMYPLKEGDAFLFKTAYTFDVSCAELFGWFIGGGKLVILGQDEEKDPFQIADFVEYQGITHINFVPSMLKLFFDLLPRERIESLLQKLKYIFSAGEALNAELHFEFNRFQSKALLINLYGPTEVTVYATSYETFPGISKNIPIGRSIHNIGTYILDRDLNLAPRGMPGDLYLSGVGLARGYFNRPDLTAEKFIPSPFESSARMYHTGDIAMWNFEGQIEFMGRKDSQVKIRGFRIEIGEIEYHLQASGLVRQVVVIAIQLNGETVLCAYFVPYNKAHDTEILLREYLKKKVPFYMIPAFFILLDQLPLNTSGKINRSQLPFPGGSTKARNIYSSALPQDAKSQRLFTLWAEVLQCSKETVTIEDNFFDQGGHSLKVMVLLARIKQEYGCNISIKNFFENPTFYYLQNCVEGHYKGEGYAQITKVEPRQHYQLTSTQKRLFVLHHMFPLSIGYHLPGAFFIDGTPDIVRLNTALAQLIERHEVLRTSFYLIDGSPVQDISPEVSIHVEEQSCIGEKIEDVIQSLIKPFALEKPPLIHCVLAQIEKGKYLLFFDIHHIIADGVSLALLTEDFIQLYRGEDTDLFSLQHKDYVCWLESYYESPAFEKQRDFWQLYLGKDVPVLNMPTDQARPIEPSFAGERITVKWEGLFIDQLRHLAAEEKATTNMVLLSLLNVLLYRYTSQEDILIGIPASGRHLHPNLHRTVGMFVNTLILRAKPKGSKRLRDFIREVRNDCLNIYENQDYPFEKMIEGVDILRENNRNPLFDIFFAYQNIPVAELKLDSLDIIPIAFAPKEVKFDLSFEVFEEQSRLIFHVDYSTQIYHKGTIERFLEHLRILTENSLKDPNQHIADLDILGQKEQDQVLLEFNNTIADFPQDKTIIQLFEKQLRRDSHKVAICTDRETLTYQQFAREISHFAADLKEKGVKRGDIVALMTERSIEMLTAIYAILKIGASYLPIDPSFPLARKEVLIKAGRPHIILVQNDDISFPPLFIEKRVYLKRYPFSYDCVCDFGESAATDLAYVLFTSGSTGEPKGVLIPHCAVVNRIHWMQREYPLSSRDVILQKTPITFDVSVWELFWWALTGSSLFLLEAGAEKDPQTMIDVIDRARVSTIHFVPSMFNAFLDYALTEKGSSLPTLRQVFTSGEALQAAHLRKFYQLFPHVALINLYGPTEATVDVSHFICSQHDEKIPIGRPIQNLFLYVLDSFGKPQPIGIPGELYIGGIGVAWGYLGKPDLTAERFIPNPFKAGGRLYKTGDLARWMPTGDIEFLGRIDHQVKIRGIRIELGEIESVLLNIESVNQSVVVAKQIPSSGYCLYAYVTLHSHCIVKASELKKILQEKLPAYMVPSEIIVLENFPLNSSGKVNLKQLPEPAVPAPESSHMALSGEDQEIADILSSIWGQLLVKKEVGLTDNFFELGGDSILAIQAVSKARSLGIELNLQQLLQLQTIGSLAQSVRKKKDKSYSSIDQTPVVGLVPLTLIQRWFFDFALEDWHHFNQAVLLQAKQPLEVLIIEKTLDILCQHHDMLRAQFAKKEGYWEQSIQKESKVQVEYHDLSDFSPGEQQTKLKGLQEVAHTGFTLEKGELLKVYYIHLGAGSKDQMFWVMHHLITDGVSWRILLEDFCKTYESMEKSQIAHLPARTLSAKAWVDVLRSKAEKGEYDVDYWLDESRFSPVSLPLDFPLSSSRLGGMEKQSACLDEEITYELLTTVSHFYQSNMQTLLLAALAETMHQAFGLEHIVVAMEGHGRKYGDVEADLSRTIGWFTSVYPIALNWDPAVPRTERIRAINQMFLQLPNKGIDYGVCRYLGKDEKQIAQLEGITPSICFNYLGQLDQTLDHLPLFEPIFMEEVGPLHSPKIPRPYLLEANIFIVHQKLHVEWNYSAHHYLSSTIEGFTTLYIDKIKAWTNLEKMFEATEFPYAKIDEKDLSSLMSQLK